MRNQSLLLSTWLHALVASVLGQGLNPITNMCIRFDGQSVTKNNTLYIDGGRETFATVVNGSTPIGNITTGYNNYLITIDLSQSWDWTSNITEKALNKTPVPGTGTLPPVLARGALWPGANDDDNIYLFGGTTSYMNTSFPGFQNPYPAQYSLWSYNIVNQTWGQYDVTQGSPNRPSSGSCTYSKDSALGFYFNGQLDSGSSQETEDLGDAPKVFLEGMIVVDTNKRTARNISTAAVVGDLPRTRGRIQYLDSIGVNGILVQMGGNQKPVNETDNTYVGDLVPMDSVDIFDVSSLSDSPSNSTSGWYRQLTTGDIPPPRLDFCLISASAPDRSSQNIYLYGGRGATEIYDDVYVLSVPSFTWIRMYNGTNPRYGHNCHRAGRAMITVGGAANYDYSTGDCDYQRMGVNVYDMTSSTWGSVYDANAKPYTVPDLVVQQIGGGKNGAATKTVPSYGFSQPGLAKIFGAPASSVNDTNPFPSPTFLTANPTSTTKAAPQHRSRPSRAHIAIIVGATVGGTALLSALAALCYFYRHRIHRLATGGPFLPPEVDGKDNIVQEAMAKEIFVELPGDTRRVELEETGRVEIDDSPSGSSARTSSHGSRTERRPPMYPWNWI